MKNWELSAGAAKLELAMQSLQRSIAQAEQHWDDPTFEAFRQEYLAPLEPKVRTALDAIHSLDQVLGRAERACRCSSSASPNS